MRTYIVNDCAKADLDEIADYISKDGLKIAIRFYQAARETFNRIFQFPGAGTLARDVDRVFG
jgi:plasmid stabilization system protein ParE